MSAVIGLELTLLTGRIAAKRLDEERMVEWPPHPARLFAALAAAFFEGGEEADERSALEWLEARTPPSIWLSEPIVSVRALEAYVPVNDVKGLAVLPDQRGLRKGKHLKLFTSAFVSDPTVTYVWDTDPPPDVRDALTRLSSRVAAVGHSSSLVRVLVVPPPSGEPTWVPSDRGRLTLRVPFPGLLDALRYAHDRYVKAGVRGPLPAIHQPYVQGSTERPEEHPLARQGVFETLWVVRKVEGPDMPALAASAVAAALYREVLRLWNDVDGLTLSGRIPEEVSGHDETGQPSQRPHVAWVALPAVGHPRSDGHLLGLGVALPKALRGEVRQRLWRVLSVLKVVRLRPGPWKVEFIGRALRSDLPSNLLSSRWTRPSRVWASVTPVILDRHPKEPFGPEAEAIVRRACERAGFPPPEVVALRPTSLVPGAPQARVFPTYPPGSGSVRVHALLVFDEPVAGPLLVGRGRYRGFGLFAPLGG